MISGKENDIKENEMNISDMDQKITSGKFKFLVFGTLFLSICISIAVYFLWNNYRKTELAINQLGEKNTMQDESRSRQINLFESKLESLDKKIEDLTNALDNISHEETESNEYWALSEIEYLLIIAMHRLHLEKDLNTAIVAMQLADDRLKSLEKPGLVVVREQLAADLNKLKAVNHIDISGMAIFLADMINRVDKLPLRKLKLSQISDQDNNEPPASGSPGQPDLYTSGRNLLKEIWQELKGLVVIKHKSELSKGLILPEQEYFLYQNLRLELENARYAVLSRDTDNLNASINIIIEWLTNYFEIKNSSVANLVDTLNKMKQLELATELPDINSSLESVRAYMHTSDF